MRALIAFILVVLAAVLQGTFNPQIRILGGEPDLVFLLVLAWAARAPLQEALLLAFAGGISIDLLSAAPLGLSTLALLPVVFTVDAVREQLFGFGFPLVLIFVAAGTILVKLIFFFGASVAGFALPPVAALAYTILPTMVYNLVGILPIYVAVRWLARRFAE
ncbi:MAG: rod shape-determining protein MreD [Anaerolineae bacterium]|nr:rod shape-determining protein MreD [Anaerolineae bacterium]